MAVVKAYLLGAALSGMVGSLGGAIEGMAPMPRLFLEARRRPFEPPAPQLQRLVLGALTVPITGLGPAFYIRVSGNWRLPVGGLLKGSLWGTLTACGGNALAMPS